MTEPVDKDSSSYQDPMARRLAAVTQRQRQLDKEFPPVAGVYDGFYQLLEPPTAEGGAFFLGSAGIVGTRLKLDLGEGAQLRSATGQALLPLPEQTARRLRDQSDKGWQIMAVIAAIYYRAQNQGVSVEIAFLSWDSGQPALAVFARNIVARLASGDHAGLELSQEQLVKVLQSQGRWFLTKASDRPGTAKGTVLFKKRAGAIQRLIALLLRHPKASNIVAIAFWLLLAAAVAGMIWLLLT